MRRRIPVARHIVGRLFRLEHGFHLFDEAALLLLGQAGERRIDDLEAHRRVGACHRVDRKVFEGLYKGTPAGKGQSTTLAWVVLMSQLMKDAGVGKHVVRLATMTDNHTEETVETRTVEIREAQPTVIKR